MTQRNDWFLLKADLNAPDETLRSLRRVPPGDRPPPGTMVARALESLLGSQVLSTADQPHYGTFHWVMGATLRDGRHVVVRVNRLSHGALDEGLCIESTVSAILAEAEYHAAPRVLGVDLDCALLPTAFGVFEYVEASPASEIDDDEDATLRVLRETAVHLRRLHEVRLPGNGPLAATGDARGRFPTWEAFLMHRLNEHIEVCRSIGAIDEQAGRNVVDMLREGARDRVADRLLHGDAGPANTLVGKTGEIHLVDWEDALVGDPLFELASVAAFHPERRWPALMDGYGVSDGLTATDHRVFWSYMLRIALARTVMRHRFGITDKPGRQPALQRIERALNALREVA